MRLLLFCFVFSILLSLSTSLVFGYGDGHRWHPEHQGAWKRMSNPPSRTDLHSFTVALRHHKQGVATLKEIVSEVSNPLSVNYGNYLSVAEIRSLLMGPDGESSALSVKNYFLKHGATSVDEVSTGDSLVVTMRIDRLESLFRIKMHHFSHRHSGRRVRRSLSAPHIPQKIAKKIELISGLYDFFDHSVERKMGKTISSKQMEGNCSATNAPEVLKVKGGADDFTATVAVYCLDYSISTNTTAPCSDHPPVAQSLTVIYQSHGYGAESLQLDFSSLDCSISAGKLLCQIPHTKIVPYQRLSVSAFVTYANGKESSVGEYLTQHTPSPFVTPDKIREYYGVPHGLKGTNPNNYQSVNAFELQYVDVQGDIQPFFESAGIEWTEPSIIGQNDPKTPGGESTLDLTYIMAIGQGVKTSFISVTGSGPAIPPGNGAYVLEWAVQVNNMTNPPLVTSISYGDTEDGYYNKFNGSYIYIERTDAELLKMAARGLTVIAGSGDAGASNVGEAGNDISPTDPDCSIARPFYPSNSHYVTSLSSTFLTTNYLPICSMQISSTEPIVCDRVGEASVSVSEGIYWTTGGAFGWRNGANPRASWQQEAVDHYLKTQADKLPPQDFFHSEGRGYPDISTIGHNLLMRLGNHLTTVDGTSASGPVFAGLVSLWNDARLNANLPPLGLLNPFLYQAANADSNAVFDIVKGSNNDGDIQQRCSNYPTYCPYGFIAAPGWDAVSGLGTPNWPVLRDAALKYATNAVKARQQLGNNDGNDDRSNASMADKVHHIMSLKKKKH